MNKLLHKGRVSSSSSCYIHISLTYLLLSPYHCNFFQVWNGEVSWLVVFSGLMLIVYLFLCVEALVGTIMILKFVSKFSIDG